DVAAQHGVVRLPHDPHRAFTDEGVELVLAEPAVALRLGHRVTQSYMRSRYARIASSTGTLRRGSTRSAMARNPSRCMRSAPPPPQAKGGIHLGARTPSNTLAPAPTTEPVPSSVPISVLA